MLAYDRHGFSILIYDSNKKVFIFIPNITKYIRIQYKNIERTVNENNKHIRKKNPDKKEARISRKKRSVSRTFMSLLTDLKRP